MKNFELDYYLLYAHIQIDYEMIVKYYIEKNCNYIHEHCGINYILK